MPHTLTVATFTGFVVTAVAVLAGCSGDSASTDDVEPGEATGVGVQLFQLPWTSIADECEQTLGPAGFAWVLTSPPNEHIVGDEWWTSYQPVSHRIESRLGTREEFADMVARCDAAGVEIVADAVINHMTGQNTAGTGFAGTAFEHYDYPGLYGPGDFHYCGLTASGDIEDYGSREQVQDCELVNLADLDTSSEAVRAKTVGYLDDLLALGVAGFRIDAAKHMAADDVEAIVSQLPEGTRILSEVIRGAGEPVQPEEYTGFGDVFEFTYGRDLAQPLQSGVWSDPTLRDADDEYVRAQHVPSDRAIVFVDNHDTERGEAKITYKRGDLYVLANVLMLGDDYGTPVVYSGYAFTDRDAGPRADEDGRAQDASCAGVDGPVDAYEDGERTCVQSWTAIRGMLAFRKAVGDAHRMPGVESGDAYGFERETRGVVAVNQGEAAETLEIPTTMSAGDYCDVVSGGPDAATDDGCRGAAFTVSDGIATLKLSGHTAAAIHIDAAAPPAS